MPVKQNIVNQVASLITQNPESFVGDPEVSSIENGSTPQVNNDPLVSAISKLRQGLQEGTSKYGFPHLQAIKSSFGLNNEEFANLRHRKLIEKAPEKGWGINMRLFETMLKQFGRRNQIPSTPIQANPQKSLSVMGDFNNLLNEARVRP